MGDNRFRLPNLPTPARSARRTFTLDSNRSMRSVTLPNVPEPVNGMIRTYENSQRTFTRPYSAKTVFFYKEGDEYFTGVRLPVSKSRYRNIDSLLDDLNSNIPMPYGVRRLMTPMGRSEIQSIDQLQHLGKYVAASGKTIRGPLQHSGYERLKKAREQAENALRRERAGGQSYWIPSSPSYKQKLRMSRTLGINVAPCKQVFFILNGKARMYRALLNPLRLQPMEQLLSEISSGLEIAIHRLYTFEGRRLISVSEVMEVSPPKIIAVPRNERPQLREKFTLPTLFPQRAEKKYNASPPFANGSGKIGFATTSLYSGETSSNSSNGIEKQPRKNGPTTAVRRNTRKTTGMPKRRLVKHITSADVPPTASDDVDSGKAASVESSVRTGETADSERNVDEDGPSTLDSARQSEADLGSMIREEHESLLGDDEEEHEENDYTKEEESAESARSREMPIEEEAEEGDDEKEKEEDEAEAEAEELPRLSPEQPEPAKVSLETEESIDNPEVNLSDDEAEVYMRGIQKTREDSEDQPSLSDSIVKKEAAATKIQAAFRGYETRKKLKRVNFVDEPPLVIEAVGVETPDNEKRAESIEEEETSSKVAKKADDNEEGPKMSYTISVLVGNRWGAESEADLYVTLFGDDRTSKKFWLKDPEGPNWLQDQDPPFRQTQLDSFTVMSTQLGTLNKLVIGHERIGFGAGVFIEHVIVTENTVEGRQFVFFCSKWLDSGQVDGKIERTLSVAGFYYFSSIPEDNVKSQGRWEFILHNGTPDGQGGTTSNLHIVGYGTEGSSLTTITTDKSLQNVPSTSLIQVDFGDIGELLKARFEIDGDGDKPDYFLEYVELRDLDTEERMAVRMGKWLDTTGSHKKAQPFREISVFRSGIQPLPIVNYEGKVFPGDRGLLKHSDLRAQVVGEFSDSGVFPLVYNEQKNEYSFKMECVFLGKITDIKIIGDFTEEGEGVLEGLSVLQDIWDRHGLKDINMANELIASRAYVRESNHCPYRYVLSQGKIVDLPEEQGGVYSKQLSFQGMEGLSTRYKKEKRESEQDNWTLSMSVEAGNNVVPSAELCVGPSSYSMNIVNGTPVRDTMNFQYRGKKMGTVDKVRIGVGALDKEQKLYVNKMKLFNSQTGEEVRYPSVDTEFTPFAVYEYPTVYPDVAPKQNHPYTISIDTKSVSDPVVVYVNLVGQQGTSGRRMLMRTDGDGTIRSGEPESFEIEAVDLGKLQRIDMSHEGSKNISWDFKVRVSVGESDYFSDNVFLSQPGEVLQCMLKEDLS